MHLVIAPPGGVGFVRQRIDKSGDFRISSAGTRYTVSGWSPDGTWPGLVSSDHLKVVGGGAATLSMSVTRNSTGSTTSVTLYAVVNDSVIDSFTVGSGSSASWDAPITVADGDLIRLEVQRTSGSGTPSITDGWIDLTPL